MKLSVVIPTIDGRQESLKRTLASYRKTLRDVEYELVVVENYPSWPAACNHGYRQTVGDVIHFGSDDLAPIAGWHVPALEWLAQHNELPAARVMNGRANGVFDNIADGADGALVHFTRVPIMRREQYNLIGPWPEIPYYADIWLSEKARALGINTRILYGYAFVHHRSEIGRIDTDANLEKSLKMLERLRKRM